MNQDVAHHARDLQIAFDSAFASAPEAKDEATRDLIAITLGCGIYALELQELAGIYSNKKIARIPSQAAGLLGIAGFRGTILPVYDLAVLIGLAPLEKPRWLAVAAKVGIAVAFDAFDGHLRIAAEDIAPHESTDGGRAHIRHFLRTPAGIRAVISLSSALRKAAGTDIQLGS
jgi:chemotaxis signal transduction protein